ncbi:MAG: cysteine synthase family protein [archaeon]
MVAFVKANVAELIGNTPLLQIDNVYAKLEFFNPGGSVKDRVAKYFLEGFQGDKIILEATSGNTGIGLAMLAAERGFKTLFVMPENVSVERRKWLKALGAELILTPGELGTEGAIEVAQELAKDSKYFMPDQFNNEASVRAHYETTGKELVEQLPKIDVFVAGIGTGGTIMGIGKRLREVNPKVKLIAVQPARGEPIQGLRNMQEKFTPSIFDPGFVNEIVDVYSADAVRTAQLLAKEKGIFAGMSSGAAMYIALKEANKKESNVVATLLPDGGAKYLSTELFK